MTVERFNIDKLFEERFRNASVRADGQVWNRINSSLNAAKQKRRAAFMWLAAASFALLIAFGSGYFIALNQISKNTITAQKNTTTGNENLAEVTPSPNKEITNDHTAAVEESNFNNPHIPVIDKTINLIKTIVNEPLNPEIPEPAEHLEKQSHSYPLSAKLLAYAASIPAQGEKLDIPTIDFYTPDEIGNKPQHRGKWTISGQAAPMYSYRDLKKGNGNIYDLANNVPKDNETRVFESDKNYYDNTESPLMAFSGGISTSYNISKRFSVQSGLFFSRMGQINNEIFVIEEEQFYGSSLQVINSSAGDVKSDNHEGLLFNKFRQSEVYVLDESNSGSVLYQNNSMLVLHFDYLEIPLQMKYKILGNKLSLSVSGGISTSLLVHNTAEIVSDNTKIDVGKTEDLSSSMLSGLVGLSFEYKLNDKLNVVIEPQYRQSFTTVNNNYYVENFPYAFSVFTGVKYSF